MTGDDIRFIRFRCRLSQSDIAKQLGVSIATVCRLEKKYIVPRRYELAIKSSFSWVFEDGKKF